MINYIKATYPIPSENNMESPAFSSFRELMDRWDESADQMAKDQIKSLLEGGDFVIFFKHGDELFAGNENARVVFANMKHPDEETNKDWVLDANFMAIDLSKALDGLTVKRMFSHKDLKKIKIIDSEEMYDILVKKSNKMNAKINLAKVIKDLPQDDEDKPHPQNMDKIGER